MSAGRARQIAGYITPHRPAVRACVGSQGNAKPVLFQELGKMALEISSQ